MAATAWDMVSEKRAHEKNPDLSRTGSQSTYTSSEPKSKHKNGARGDDGLLVPGSQSDETSGQEGVRPGARFGGFGFGKQGERDGKIKISRPMETLPRQSFSCSLSM